jgi:hypothetical protein
MFSELKDLTTNASRCNVFSDVPLTESGYPTPTALWRVLTGKPSIGSMGGYRNMYMSLITEDVFKKYKEKRSVLTVAKVGVLCTEVPNSALSMVYADEVSYEQWIDAVVGSASVPLFAPPSGPSMFMDGGVRVHNPSYYHTAICGCKDITEMIEVYAREKHNLNDRYLIRRYDYLKNLFTSLKWYVETASTQISLMGESYVDLYCKNRGIALRKIHTGNNMHSMFDFDEERLNRGYWHGLSEATKVMREQVEKVYPVLDDKAVNDTFTPIDCYHVYGTDAVPKCIKCGFVLDLE